LSKLLGLLFVSISDMSVGSRFDSYLTNMKLPWDDKNVDKQKKMTVGAVECYIQKDKNDYKFERAWTKTFPTQMICIWWDSTTGTVVAGY
jgi:hypothetical protein